VKGCASYFEASFASSAPSSLTFGDVTNKDWKADSGLFAFELYAIDFGTYYRIARSQASNLKITESMLTTGSINSFSIVPVDTF